MKDFLKVLPPLKSEQLATCENLAAERVLRFIGEMPTLSDYTSRISQGSTLRQLLFMVLTPIDWFMIPLLASLFMVSLSHMLTFAGLVGMSSYHYAPENFEGLWFSTFWVVIITQIGFFFMSEVGIIYFYNRYKIVDGGSKLHSLNFWMAVFFAILTFVANIFSLLHNADNILHIALAVFVGALIPSATLLLGDRFAEISLEIVSAKRSYTEAYNRARKAYEEDLLSWSQINKDPTTFDNKDGKNSYQIYLGRAIVDYYKRYIVSTSVFKANNPDFTFTPDIELQLAAREIAKMSSFEKLDQVVQLFLS